MNVDSVVLGGKKFQILRICTAICRFQDINLFLAVLRQNLTLYSLSWFNELTPLHQAQFFASLQNSCKSGRAFGIIRIPETFMLCHASIKYKTGFFSHYFVRINCSLIYISYKTVVRLFARQQLSLCCLSLGSQQRS